MTNIQTDAIRVFQKRVHDMTNTNQRELRLTSQEARNISNELSQLTAILLDLQSKNVTDNSVDISIIGSKF